MCTFVAVGATVAAAPTVSLWTSLASGDAANGRCPRVWFISIIFSPPNPTFLSLTYCRPLLALEIVTAWLISSPLVIVAIPAPMTMALCLRVNHEARRDKPGSLALKLFGNYRNLRKRADFSRRLRLQAALCFYSIQRPE